MIGNDPGRSNKRQPIALAVDLVPLGEAEKRERTYTENISAQGVRVHSQRHWQPGKQVDVISVRDQTAVRGEIVYCLRHSQDGFFAGIRLRKCPSWSVIQWFTR